MESAPPTSEEAMGIMWSIFIGKSKIDLTLSVTSWVCMCVCMCGCVCGGGGVSVDGGCVNG